MSERRLENQFTWSKSRHDKWMDCRRAYYYQYYASWGGWERDAPDPIRELYVLKKLSSRWQWAGKVVHEAIRQLLARARVTGQFEPLDKWLFRIRASARHEWLDSNQKAYRTAPGRIAGMVEHEYGEAIAREEWKRLYEEVIERSLRNFYQSEAFLEVRAIPREAWLSVDELDSWTFEGVKIWVALDFAARRSDGKLIILDWKTGQERGVDKTQIAIYTLYAKEKWKVAADAVEGGLVYLVGSSVERVKLEADEPLLDACREEMRQSIRDMRGVLIDLNSNVAHPIEKFPQRSEIVGCHGCPFRRPCGREGSATLSMSA